MITYSSAAINLKRLVLLRAIVLAAQLGAVWLAYDHGGLRLPLVPLALVFSISAVVNGITWLRLRWRQPVSDVELFVHLVFDVAMLTLALYYTGGSTNPFAPLFLLPLTLTAAALPGAYTWAMLGLTGACYSLLLFYYVPLPGQHAAHAADFRLHVIGMWLGFLVGAALIAYFAVYMARTLRERDQLHAQMRERELKHQRVLALGTLAAGAAHELGTPLSTMAVLV
ncbi:MAG: sensor histidine kinase, partial [Gammaproteobacteria bacterium]